MNKKKPHTEKRNIDLGVRVSFSEEKKILKQAELLGMSKSEFVRFVCLNSKLSVTCI